MLKPTEVAFLLVLENSSESHYNDACKPVSVCELLRIENYGPPLADVTSQRRAQEPVSAVQAPASPPLPKAAAAPQLSGITPPPPSASSGFGQCCH